jgi:hypothetical protein
MIFVGLPSRPRRPAPPAGPCFSTYFGTLDAEEGTPLSSRTLLWMSSGVFEEAVEVAGDVALEAADGFAAGSSLLG